MSTKFFTNDHENTLIRKFEGVLTYNPNIHHFDILVGYLRASGYFKIRPFLNQVPKIRILVGINVDHLIANSHQKGLEFFKNHEKTREEFIQDTIKDVEDAGYQKDIETGILQFLDDLIQKKIELRAHPEKKIHAKVYIFRPEPFNAHTPAQVITGSSNLTDAGIGSGNQHNYEFNVQLNDYQDIAFASIEFEKLWDESVEILPIDVQNIKKKTYLNDETTPFELFIKLLIEYFEDSIDYDPVSIGDLPANFKKLTYQIDAVSEGFNMLMKHNGFILADVVGLGKTIIATLVAQKFIYQNGKSYTKILVVYPPAVENNWKNTFKNFDVDRNTKFISNGSLKKILDEDPNYWNKEEYDLIIVDEAHKFRNHNSGMFNDLQLICKSPRPNKGYIKGEKKKVILVTATPLNNKPDDIFYQIQLFQDARQSTLPITNLTSFFSPLMERYKMLKRDKSLDVDILRDLFDKIRKNVIEPITIRRTRSDLENIKEYKEDLNAQGILFPKVEPPQKIEYEMDEQLNQLFYNSIDSLTNTDKLTYARYQAIAWLKPDIQNKYYENAEIVSKSLALIMKTQLVKRLESSFYAFRKSLLNFREANDRMIKMFENDKIFIAPDADINKLIDKGISDEEIELEIAKLSEENPKNQTFQADDFDPHFVEMLKKDSKILNDLVEKWNNLKEDPKLKEFLEKIDSQFLKKDINPEGKLVIFSESKDTVNYLKDALEKQGRKDILAIFAGNRKEKYDTIVENFDANCPVNKQQNSVNIIITTEVLAEGVNLHRSNVIIHYDTPWNSTRLMQRIGRVNRIGTKANTIYNFIFYPSAQGDSEIRLTKTSLMKIQAFHTAFGEDNQVYSQDEILDDVKLFNESALREEIDEKTKYLYLLRNFRKDNPKKFNEIKKLPLKSRTCRNANSIGKIQLQNNTVAFLKTEIKNEFYLIDSNHQAKEITPIEAFKIFEAAPIEKSFPLIPEHHQQVAIAINYFEKIEYQSVASSNESGAMGGVAQAAKKYLSDLIKCIHENDDLKHDMKRLLQLIDIGKYAALARDVDRLRKKKPKFEIALQELKKIAGRYDSEASKTPQNDIIKKTVLIISESFE